MFTKSAAALLLAAGLSLAACSGAIQTPAPQAPATPTDGGAGPSTTAATSTTAASIAPSIAPSPTAASDPVGNGGGRGYGGGYGNPTPGGSGTPDPSAAASTVSIAQSALGDILVDSQGLTLYAFLGDAGGQPTCTGSCAGNWPGELVRGRITVGAGLSADLFTSVDRPDGGKQLKAGTWPLYLLAGSTPGDTTGQGTINKWYVVSPTGDMIK